MLLKQLKKINGTSQIMYDYICHKLTFSYSKKESPYSIKDYEQKHIEKEKTQENRPASSFAL